MKTRNHHNQRGVTLIETLLYIALFSIFIVSSIPALIDMNLWHAKQNVFADSIQNSMFFDGKIGNMVRQSDNILLPLAGDNSEMLRVSLPGTGIQKITLENSAIVLTDESSSETYVLHATSTKISNLNFYQSSVAAGPREIRMSMNSNGFEFGTTSYLFSP